MAPPTDSPVRLHLKSPDTEDFVRRFARNVTRGGIFLPSRESRDVGSSIRFELTLEDDHIVFAGEGVVTWVKPQGMGVKFTTLDPAATPILERLLSRRREEQETKAPAAQAPAAAAPPAAPAAAAAPAAPAAAAAPAAPATAAAPAVPAAAAGPAAPAPANAAAPAPANVAASSRKLMPMPWGSASPERKLTPLPPAPASPENVEAPRLPAKPGPVASEKRSPIGRILVWSAVLGAIALVAVSVNRARFGVGSSHAPKAVVETSQPTAAAPAKPAPVEVAAAPPVPAAAPPVPAAAPPVPAAAPPVPAAAPVEAAAPPPAAEAPTAEPANEAPSPVARAGSLRVEKLLVGPAYKHFTCPNPTSRFSLRSHKTVNVCLEVEHRPGKAERLTIVWEKDGRFAGKTPVEIAAKRPDVRTRAHMKLGRSRLGSWSVRVESARKVTLAQTTFNVAP